ncbi:dTMP kinase [Candidatus Chlamydia sanziniae]|uniref:Thymidylate kinase n=1 Tax=Candidatus Chlamydia sanziniae TaxID=1806891 RepID=A0A1A9HVK9_9CHLA|nr:dTMP kinase [Candidatus Chlamydia sanziniae]ANH79018.1 Thymidylate kinase [Candidatus Chlamydia sanziniae]
MFIVIEGGEGAGKSSLAEALHKQFVVVQNKKVFRTREPGGSKLGELLRDFILDPSKSCLSTYSELFLFLAMRAQHIEEKILPALQNGYLVLCERFHDSTIVYQGIAEQLGASFVADLCYKVQGLKPFLPDLILLLDIPAEIGLQRKQQQKSLDKFEQKPLSYHHAIRQGFLALAKAHPSRYLILNACQALTSSVDQVMKRIGLNLCK